MRTLGLIFSVLAIPLTALILYTSYYDANPAIRTFLDRNGKIIGSLNPSYQGIQYWTPVSQIPAALARETIREEDRWFFWHPGINPISLSKAAFDNLLHGRVVRGGSTITQQLAKNLMGSPPRTLWNKVRESVLALGLELKHSKSWILERYLNTAYYGRRSYGLAAAAKTYFGKELTALSSDEIEFLVERPKAPSRSVPAKPDTSLQSGRDTALPPMSPHLPLPPVARHFLEYVAGQTPNSAPQLQTTLDLELQTKLEEAIARLLAGRAYEDSKLTAAAVVIDVKTGDILAMVGSRDYFDETIDGQVNAAVALRQPGSTLKPFTYFAAFSKGYGPNSIVPDEPLSFQAAGVEESDAYAPQNFDRRYHGDMTIREALANSYNVPAVVTLNEIGLSAYHELLRRFGFTTLNRPPLHYGLAVTLGSGEVTLLELTNAYAALARGGAFYPYRVVPVGARGHIPLPPTPILPNASQLAAQVTGILSDPTARLKAFGFNESMAVAGHDVAVKTGTSYEHRDNWTVGYTPSYAVGVWVGHADGSPMIGPDGTMPTTGATGAAPLWHAAMETVLKDRPVEKFANVRDSHVGTRTLAPLQTKPRNAIKILSPVANATFRIHSYLPAEHQKIAAEAEVGLDKKLRWYVDDRFLAVSQGKERIWIVPESGKHVLRVEDEQGRHEEIAFRVVNEDNN